MRDTRWKRLADPTNTAPEPDASFYVGANTEVWLAAPDEGEAAPMAFEAASPPDLVVEVEGTHFDGDRAGPRPVPASLALPGLEAAFPPNASDLTRHLGNEALEELIAVALAATRKFYAAP